MSESYHFKKVLFYVPSPDDERAEQLAQNYEKEAKDSGYPQVAFGVVDHGGKKGIWIGCKDVIEGIKCNIALFGERSNLNNRIFLDVRENQHLDLFYVESIKDHLTGTGIDFEYIREENSHAFRLPRLSDQLELVRTLFSFKDTPFTRSPSRPTREGRSFYVSLSCDSVN
ncbi:MAG TPA: hypothetical protein DCY07_01800 [Rhodospirillaceae bacterium]|nr:hypothetical protein [Rhodospirillaceae bacterium]